MPTQDEISRLMRDAPARALDENIQKLSDIMRMPKNADITLRRFPVLGADACALYCEGISYSEGIAEWIIRPCVWAKATPDSIKPEDMAKHVRENVIYAAQTKRADTLGDVAREVLNGLCALLIDGCAEALIIDTRHLPQRSVSHTNNESVVLGSQEGFVESLRTNISLVRKNLRSPALVTEMIPVGSVNRINTALMYLDGVADDIALAEARKRLMSITRETVGGTGQIEQLIEDRPFALLPQILQTERPDRAAAGLSEGQFAILADNSPYALLAPATAYHFLHASDDTFMRWQYGTFIRIIRSIGMAFSLLLPGLYIALTQYHSHLLPLNLISSIAEARAKVPFPILIEILLMEFSFYLINEAGTRIPSQIGSALGIVGALILGQAAVSASIISPILIIIVALTGLGNFVIPNYGFSLAVELYRLFVLLAGAAFGLYGIVLACLIIMSGVCSLRSFGVPYAAPFAPYRPHNRDIILRLPLWMQKLPMFFADRRARERGSKSA